MAKPNYSFDKRQREIAKKKQQDEKRQKKLAKGEARTGADADPATRPDGPSGTPPKSGSAQP
ncbi:MAG: hypothetical protein ACHP7D_05870 [Lysobacterales bacterium]